VLRNILLGSIGVSPASHCRSAPPKKGERRGSSSTLSPSMSVVCNTLIGVEKSLYLLS